MRKRSRSALFSVALLAACTPYAPQEQAGTLGMEAGEVVLTGTPRVVGSAPVDTRLVLETEDGTTPRVVGPLAGEIRNLGGARLRVNGRMEDDSLRATGYEIVSVDGRPVEMGVVEQAAGGGLQLRRSDEGVVALSGAAANLRVGQKVWVQGAATRSVTVQTYGVISQ